jgi:TolB protein
MRSILRKILLLSLFGLSISNSQAELVIEITKGVKAAVPIAVVPFSWQSSSGQPATDFASVIQADLTRSGFFKTLAEEDMLTKPTLVENVRYRNWKALGQDYLLIGRVEEIAGKYQVQFRLLDVYKGAQLVGQQWPSVSENGLRKVAHQISDMVYEKLTGKKGVFSSRISYITVITKANNKKSHKLNVADADGYNEQSIYSSSEPLMSPAWSADGKKIAYVSFENKRPEIYIQTLVTGKRIKVPSFKGANNSPAFSPDGTELALVLSKDGSFDIYIFNINNRSFRKVTKSYGIDTEPSWSPDGRNIVYTSDRGGKPQLYMVPSTGGQSERLTFDGDYNARGSFSADGKNLVMIHMNKGDYRIAVMDMATHTINVLTAGRYDESPSFSPNGDMILYSSRKGKASILSSVSVDGHMRQNLSFGNGEEREPAWLPK